MKRHSITKAMELTKNDENEEDTTSVSLNLERIFNQCQEDAKKLRWFKIVFVGDCEVGKTTIIKSFCDAKFSKKYIPTVGVDYGFKLLHQVRLHMWDLSGNKQYRDVRNEMYEAADLAILVYDVNTYATFQSLDKFWMPEMKKYDIGDALIGCLGNKTDVNCLRNSTASLGDLTGRDTRRGSGPPAVTSANVTNGGVNNSVKLFEVEKWCFKEGIRHYTVSAATGDNIHTAIEQLVKLRLRKLGEDHLIETQ